MIPDFPTSNLRDRRAPFRFRAPIQLRPQDPKPGLVINGRRTIKRRAEDTELELVAGINGIQDLTSPVATSRKGAIEPMAPSSDAGAASGLEPDSMPTTPPSSTYFSRLATGLANSTHMLQRSVGAVGKMLFYFRETVSGALGQFNRLLRPQTYKIDELRTYINDNKYVSNKRIKLTLNGSPFPAGEEPQNNQIQIDSNPDVYWINQYELDRLIQDYRRFLLSIEQVWNTIEAYPCREDMNKALKPLSHTLVSSTDDGKALYEGRSDLCTLFYQAFHRVFAYLDKIYEISAVVRIRDENSIIPHFLDYEISVKQQDDLRRIKDFLSAAPLPTVCKNVLQMGGNCHVGIPFWFLDQVLLDLQAITHNIPAPSYISSSEYRDQVEETFPLPKRTDLKFHLLLPGTFPEDVRPELVQSLPKLQQEREETINPANLESPASALPVPLTPPESPNTIIRRRTYSKGAFIGATYPEESISQITPEEYSSDLYQRSENYRAIKSAYITDFQPKSPLKSVNAAALQSILKKTRSQATKRTPKRLGIARAPKTVRFTDSTSSPRPRSHTGFEIPSITKDGTSPETGTRDPDWLVYLLEIPKGGYEKSPFIKHTPSWGSWPPLHRIPKTKSQGDTIDPTRRIQEILAIPSELSLEISDDTKAGIAIRKEQAALKAAEEARLAAEAKKRAAEEKAKRELEARLAKSGGLRIPARRFVMSMGADWQARAQSTLRAAASTTLATTGEGVELRRHDFAKVVPATEWLNDEIINGSLNWLDQAINSAAGIKDVKKNTRKCLALSSFFFKHLKEQGGRRTQRTLRRAGVEKKNFLDVNTILLPICEHSHWTLLVIRPSKRSVAHMDSLNPRGCAGYTNLALAWVRDVLEDLYKPEEWTVISHESPMQTNGWDCGVHTVTNAMCVALGLSPIDSYTSEDMPAQRIRIACMLLNGGFKGEFDLRLY